MKNFNGNIDFPLFLSKIHTSSVFHMYDFQISQIEMYEFIHKMYEKNADWDHFLKNILADDLHFATLYST